jgi:transposase-like protein
MLADASDSTLRQNSAPARLAPRRQYSLEFKLEILKEISAPDASVASIARRHGLNSNMVFGWRRLLQEGKLTGSAKSREKLCLPLPAAFAPVRVVPDDEARPAVRTRERACAPSGPRITIAVPGKFTVRLDSEIDEEALRRVLRAVRDLT